MKKKQKYKDVIVQKKTFFEKVKDFFKLLGAIFILFILMYILMQIASSRRQDRLERISENEKIVIGTIIETGNMKGSYAIAEYYLKNTRYKRNQGSPSCYTYEGEHYEVILDSLNPIESEIDFTKPVFLNSQITSITSGIISYIDDYTIRYEYEVNGLAFRKFQRYKQLKSNVVENKVFPVEYLVDNCKISRIKIN